MRFYKYQGAGNDFLIADNRGGAISVSDGVLCFEEDGHSRSIGISDICDRRYGVGADGLMLLESSAENDFRMTYFNSDGSGGMMCGNGGRCIVAFAADMGIEAFDFDAADGFHTAQILKTDGRTRIVRLKMKDVSCIRYHQALDGVSCPSEGWFLDTGTRHYVRFVKDIEAYDIVAEGRHIRWNADELKPEGANVNFVEPCEGGVKVRTYEKGVEDETFACGTGIVASVIASHLEFPGSLPECGTGCFRYDVYAKRDALAVEFVENESDGRAFTDVWLTGPATCVAEIIL